MDGVFLLVPIVLPLLLSLTVFFLPWKAGCRRWQIGIMAAVLLCAGALWAMILLFPEKGLSFAPVGRIVFSLRFDALGRFFAGIVATLWPFATLYALEYMQGDPDEKIFFLFYLLSFGATAGVCLAGNLLTLYVFYEFLSLSTIPLVMHGFSADHRHAAREYAVFSIGGASLALIGILWLLQTGSASAFQYSGALTDAALASPALQPVFLLLLLGLGVKAAIFPFHGWLPTASVAPTPVTALLHAVAVVKAGVFAVMRLCFYVFPAERMKGTPAQIAALSLAAFTVVFGAAMALKERHFKRRLAYSTVSNLSYILCGVLLMTPSGFSAALLHMVFHAMMKIASFFVAGAVMRCAGVPYLYEMPGLGKKYPLCFGCFTVCALSLMGVPGFSGFQSKYRLLLACVESGDTAGWITIAALLTGALLCAVYMLTVVIAVFFPGKGCDRFPPEKAVQKPGWRMLTPIVLFAALTLLAGLFPAPIRSITDAIAGIV